LVIGNSVTPRKLIRNAKHFAKNVMRINAEFLDTKLLIRAGIFNVYCKHLEDVDIDDQNSRDGRDSRMDNNAAETSNRPVFPFDHYTCTLNTPFEMQLSSTVSHLDLDRDPNDDLDDPNSSHWAHEVGKHIAKAPYCESMRNFN
jgi:hypothetical protein